MSSIISIVEVARRLGISLSDVKSLVKQGILHPEKDKDDEYYFSPKDIEAIRSSNNLTLSEEVAQVGIQIQREVVSTVSGLQKILKTVGLLGISAFTCLALLINGIAILFRAYPGKVSDFFGYYYRFNVLENSQVLAAATGPNDIAVKTSILADVIKPVTGPSLLIVKALDSKMYEQIVTNPNVGVSLPGPPGEQGPPGPEGAVGPQGLQGPAGTNGIDGTNGTNGSNTTEVDTLSSVTTRGAETSTAISFNGGITTSTLKIGSGSIILKHLSTTTTFDADEIASGDCNDAATVPLVGVNVGDSVIVTPTSTSGGVETLKVSWNSYVSSVDTVIIKICSIKGKQDPPSQTWRVDVWQH